jgi:hypothetical protein
MCSPEMGLDVLVIKKLMIQIIVLQPHLHQTELMKFGKNNALDSYHYVESLNSGSFR